MKKLEEKEMSFLDHLEELRWHIIRSLIAIMIFAILAFLSKSIVFGKIILGPSKSDFWTYKVLCEIGQWINVNAFCIEKLPFMMVKNKDQQYISERSKYIHENIKDSNDLEKTTFKKLLDEIDIKVENLFNA